MDIDQAFEEFMEFPKGSNGKYVTTVSAKLFAKHCVEKLQAEADRLRKHNDELRRYNVGFAESELKLKQERDQLKEQLSGILLYAAVFDDGSDGAEGESANRIIESMRQMATHTLADHDAEVIERALDHLERKATADGFFTIDPFWLKEYAAQIRQRAKESPNEA